MNLNYIFLQPTEYGQTGLHGVLVPLPVALATKQGQGHALLPLVWQGEGTVLVQRRNPTNVIPGLVQVKDLLILIWALKRQRICEPAARQYQQLKLQRAHQAPELQSFLKVKVTLN